jgi:cell division protein FtsB
VNATVGLYRARIGLVVAGIASLVVLACWFPLGQLIRQRSELATLSSQVSSVDAHNASLRVEVRALHKNVTIETLAHQEFGLVKPGQIPYVILPQAGSSSGSPALSAKPIPVSDLVADQPVVAPHVSVSTPTGPGFWSRFTSRLEFWRHSG